MVKGTIIEEKNCFSDDSARRFMQTFQQTSFYQAIPIYLFTFSPVTPLFIGVSVGEEFSLSLHPLFTHIGFNWFSCYTHNYMPEP